MKKCALCFLILFLLPIHLMSQLPNIHLNRLLKEDASQKINIAVQLEEQQKDLLNHAEVTYKYQQGGWYHLYLPLRLLQQKYAEGQIKNIYYQFDMPVELADTMRQVSNIDSVHQAFAPLQDSVKGKNVVLGFVDTGVDYNHEDFKLDNGESRVLYYWDQSLPFDAQRTPAKYGYGQVWTKAEIEAGTSTSGDNSGHGSTVTGIAAGNGRATGYNQGAAPETDLIIVKTDFSLPNWSLTVADAADFVYSMADTLGKPAVMNASVGGYLNSHDGLDPSAQYIDSLLTDKNGRVFVCAAGNSGHTDPYQVGATVTADTNFTWMDVNMSSTFNNNPAAYMTLWSDTADFEQVEFAIGADATNPFIKRDRTNFFTIQDVLGGVVNDTIFNSNGDTVAVVEFSASIINGVYNLDVLIENPDSTDYYYRFMTTGSGSYDLWTAEWMGISKIPTEAGDVPDIVDFPDMAFYEHPDTMQSIVGYWACSEKVITVANFENRSSYVDYNGDTQMNLATAGSIAEACSRGPSRTGAQKPDVAAPGNFSLSAGPLWLLSNWQTNNADKVEVGGMHVRNGGTSMASPIVAGLAALLLERCPNASYQDIQDMIYDHTYEDGFTSTVPNYRWGRGKLNGFQSAKSTTYDFSISGDSVVCDGVPVNFTSQGVFSNIVWNDGSTSTSLSVTQENTIFATAFDNRSCIMKSDTFEVAVGTTPNPAVINALANGLFASPGDLYQWYLDGNPINNAQGQFYIPNATGDYSVIISDEAGCWVETLPYYIDYSQIDFWEGNDLVVFPNPFQSSIYLLGDTVPVEKIVISDLNGKLVYEVEQPQFVSGLYEIKNLNFSAGIYMFSVFQEDRVTRVKVVKE